MLDAFTQVLVKQASDKDAEDKLTRQMLSLPMKDLQKIASGVQLKAAFSGDGDNDWLCKYEDTPLYEKAIALEEELLKIEGERIQKRMDRPVEDDLWTREDMIRLKKRQLDLELSKARASDDVEDVLEDDGDEEDDEEDDDEASEEKSARAFTRKLAHVQGRRAPTVTVTQRTKTAAARRPVARTKVASAPRLTNTVDKLASFEMAGRALAHVLHKQAAEYTPEEQARIRSSTGMGALGGALGGLGQAAQHVYGRAGDLETVGMPAAMGALGGAGAEGLQGGIRAGVGSTAGALAGGATGSLLGTAGQSALLGIGSSNSGIQTLAQHAPTISATIGGVGGGAFGGAMGARSAARANIESERNAPKREKEQARKAKDQAAAQAEQASHTRRLELLEAKARANATPEETAHTRSLELLRSLPGAGKTASVKVAAMLMVKTALSMNQIKGGIKGALGGAAKDGALGTAVGAAGGAIGGAPFAGVGAAPGAAIGAASGAIGGVISGGLSGWQKGVQGAT